MNKFQRHFINLIFPAFVFGSITGIFTSLVIILYKLLAKFVIEFSENAYAFLSKALYIVPIVLVVLFGLSILFSYIYKKQPRVSGGGIPSAIALLRSIVRFDWLKTLIGVFFMSLSSFLIGVPLGNEGPSVLMGTAIGKGSINLFAKKHPMWSRYTMTGGACAGFAVATGASVSGVMFAIEEAHQRISPMILLVGTISVISAQVVSQILCPMLGLSLTLFPSVPIITFAMSDLWIALVVGVIIGLFAVAFLKYYHLINKFFNVILKKVPHSVKIFIVYALTIVLGIISFSFISTGHEIFSLVLKENIAIWGLAILLLVRITLTLFANSNKLTGGVFVPILAIGALVASIVGKGLESLFGLSSAYYTAILVLGISACVSSMMKMPLTAIVFSLEVFGCVDNLIFIIIAVALSCIITEIFGVKGMNDNIVENIVKEQEETHERKVIDTHVTIKKGSFAENMHSKDILWPANFFLLSIAKNKSSIEQIDQQGEIVFSEGDILHVRYLTFDEEQTKEELNSIVGEQNYEESEPITS